MKQKEKVMRLLVFLGRGIEFAIGLAAFCLMLLAAGTAGWTGLKP